MFNLLTVEHLYTHPIKGWTCYIKPEKGQRDFLCLNSFCLFFIVKIELCKRLNK